jgi:hypothetical protein
MKLQLRQARSTMLVELVEVGIERDLLRAGSSLPFRSAHSRTCMARSHGAAGAGKNPRSEGRLHARARGEVVQRPSRGSLLHSQEKGLKGESRGEQ